MSSVAHFVFVTCQVGAEPALKAEIARLWPDWRFAYSRPGFLSFKLPLDTQMDEDFALRSVFARAYATSLGCARGDSAEELARQVWRLVSDGPIDRLHVWSRDPVAPGHQGFEPGLTAAAQQAAESILAELPGDRCSVDSPQVLTSPTRRGDRVLDCVLVEPNEWWVGTHRASSRPTRWPGGLWPGEAPQEMVSRAYMKVREAVDWMALPIKPGQRCVDLGCAPGGSSQALLDCGLRVTGIDPANVDPRIAGHPNFRHVRKRGSDLKRKEYQEFQWLVADMNVAPAFALDAVRDIVTHRTVNIRGLILNLKLIDWKLAAEVPNYVAEVRTWGFPVVRARQLSQNRQEICLAGLKSARHPHRRRRRSHKSSASAVNDSDPAANRA